MSAHPARVLIGGGGVSAATAAYLLAGAGFELMGSAHPTGSSAPVVMLSAAALGLLRDVFGRAELFADRPPILRRIVAWGGGEPVAVPHTAVVVSGSDLAAALPMPAASCVKAPDFTLHAAPPFPVGTLHRFGERTAMAAEVVLARGADAHACHVEAISSGWLFLIPRGDQRAWLLAVGGAPDAFLGDSRLVAAQIDTVGPVVARFETAPRMLDALAGDGWLACGTQAIAFDPICGDGTAQAVREGILAAAVFAALRDGGDSSALLGHYRALLLAAMRRHLQISLPFYRSGGSSPWWRAQAEAVCEGYDWCTARLAMMPEPRFVLRGARLVPRELAA